MENIRSNEEFRNKVIEELNSARQDPKKYSEKIRSYIKYFKGRILILPNQIGLMTNEGEEAFKEASEFLLSLYPITKFKYNPGLTHVAHDYMKEIQKSVSFFPMSSRVFGSFISRLKALLLSI